MGSKWAKNTCPSIPNGPRSLLEKCVFDLFLTHFWSQNGPFSRHFGILHGPKHITTGSKWAKQSCLSIPNGPRSLLEKCAFDPFSTHLSSQNGPFSRHFAILHGPKRATTGSKRAKNTCLSIPSGLGTTLEKMIFFAQGTLVDPPLAPAVRGAGCPPAAANDHWYGGLSGSLGDSDAWKPQKVGVCGSTMSLRLGVSSGFWGCFGRKMAVFGPKLRRFGRAPPDLAPPPGPSPLSFWL